MRRMILLVVLSLLACTLVQAEVNRIGGSITLGGNRHHGWSPRVTISFGQPCWPMPIQPCQPSFGYGWPTPQYNPGYFPGTSPMYGGYNLYGYGGDGYYADYAEAYRQRLEQLERQKRYQLEEQARRAGRRAAEQQFNYGGYGY